MKKRLFAFALSLVLTFGLTTPILAANSPDSTTIGLDAKVTGVANKEDSKVQSSAIGADDYTNGLKATKENYGDSKIDKVIAATDLTYEGTPSAGGVQVKLWVNDENVTASNQSSFIVAHKTSSGWEYIPLDGAGDGYVIFTMREFSPVLLIKATSALTQSNSVYTYDPQTPDGYFSTASPNHAHSYGTPTYTWSDDMKTCTGTRVCKDDASHVDTAVSKTVTSTVTKAATCTAVGEMTYTATFSDAAYTTQTKPVSIPKIAHDYGEDGKCKVCNADKTNSNPSGGSDDDNKDDNGGGNGGTSGKDDNGNGGNSNGTNGGGNGNNATDDNAALIKTLVAQIQLLMDKISNQKPSTTTNNYYTTTNNGGAATATNTTGATAATGSGAKTSPKTGQGIPMWPITAGFMVAGIAFCGKKAYDFSEK